MAAAKQVPGTLSSNQAPSTSYRRGSAAHSGMISLVAIARKLADAVWHVRQLHVRTTRRFVQR